MGGKVEFCRGVEKGELHVHLNGLLSPDTVRRLLEEEDVDIPSGFCPETDLTILQPASSLTEYLRPWDALRLVPGTRANLRIIVSDAFENLKRDNVSFVELRNTVVYIAHLNKISVADALAWLVEEVDDLAEKYNIEAGLILTIPRGDYACDHLSALTGAYVDIGKPSTIVGLDLAGNERAASPMSLGSRFLEAKERYGLNVTIHAGETGSSENIKDAILNFGADRIGHGTAAVKDQEVMDLLVSRNICVEVCPISNRLTGAVMPGDSHPVIEFIEQGVPFVICSDNPGIHGSSLSEDYLLFAQEADSSVLLNDMLATQRQYSFLRRAKWI